MNLRTRLLVTVSALTMFAGVGLVGSVSAGAVTTFNVANDHATCNTASGTTKFTQHLKNSGPTTGAQTIKLTLAFAGCFDDDNNNVKMFKGATTATLTSNNGWNCAGLLGPITVSGSAQVVWTPGAAQAFNPKTTSGTALKSATNLHLTQVSGSTFSVPAANSPWNASYGYFSIGTSYGTAPITTTVDFAGNSSWFAATTQQDLGNILTTCGSTAGIATLNFGIGATHWGGGANSSSSSTTCPANTSCASPTDVSSDGTTFLQVNADASAGSQTLTVQVGGSGPIGAPAPAVGPAPMLCSLQGSGSVISQYQTTASDAAKVGDYTVFGAGATFANKFYAAHTDISGCFGSHDPFNGWSPTDSNATWANGPYTYRAAPLDSSTTLYEAFLGSCALHPKPCFVNTNGGTFNTTQVRSPASAADPRVSH